MKRWWLLTNALMLLAAGTAHAQFTITRTSAPKFLFGTQENVYGNYATYVIQNTGPARAAVWVTIDQLTGTHLRLADYEDGVMYLGPMAAGETRLVGFYLKTILTTDTTSAQSHYINVHLAKPPSAATYSQQFTINDVHNEQRAMANKPRITVNTPNPPYLGGTVTVTYEGETGTLGGARDLLFTPAAQLGWRADAFKLYDAQIVFTGGNNTTLDKQTYFILPNSANSSYVARFYFRIVQLTPAPTDALPLVFIRSGVNLMKYSTVDPAEIPPIQPSLNSLLLAKSASTNYLSGAGTVTFTLTLTNSAGYPVTVDDIVDTLPSLPANATYVTGSAEYAGTPIANPAISGNTLTWLGGFLVPAHSARELTFRAVIPDSVGAYTNSAVAHIGSVPIDTTQNTADDAPARAVVTVAQWADVSVTKAGEFASVGAGSNFVYTITVNNLGPATATNIVVTDTLPVGATFVSASAGGTNVNGIVGWPAFTLLNGATSNLFVTINAPGDGMLTNTAQAAAASLDPDLANNTNTVVTPVNPLADLVADKSVNTNAVAGEPLLYTLSVTNLGPSAATNVVVADTLPAGVEFISADGGGNFSGGVVTWPPLNLAAGAFTNFTLTVSIPGNGILTNQMTLTSPVADPTPGNNTSLVVSVISPRADVSLVKTGTNLVVAGGSLVYSLAVSNAGPSVATNLVVNDTLPAGLIFDSASGGITPVGGVLTWAAFDLAAGAATNFTVTGTAPGEGVLTNTASAISPVLDPGLTPNTGTVVTAVSWLADVRVWKTAEAARVGAGSNLTYSILVTNAGPSTATNLVVRDLLPEGVALVSATGGVTPSSGIITWPTFALVGGTFTNLQVVITAPGEGTLTNRADLAGDVPDPNPGNNTNTVVTPVDLVANLEITKTAAATVIAGSNLTYTITVANLGPSPATNVVVTDVLPADVNFVSATGGITPVAGVLTWPALTLGTGATSNLEVVVTAPGTGVLTNTAYLTSPIYDPTGDNNTNTVTTTVTESADVAVFKAGPATSQAGSNITYTIVVTNLGVSAAANVVVTDTLPVGVTFVSASGGVTPVGGVVTWPALPSLANGAAATFIVTVLPTGDGILTNVAASTAATADPNPGNNNGTAADSQVITTVTTTGVSVSGQLFHDRQPNGTLDPGETWTDGTNVYVNLVQSGAVIQSVALGAGSGAFAFSNVVAGAYDIVVAAAADSVTPAAPADWIFTGPDTGHRALVVAGAPVASQDFGLFHGGRLAGQVANGATGIAGVTVRLTDATGATTYGTATTDGAGHYTLHVPFSLGAATFKVIETNITPYLSLSGSAGNTGGSYDRASDTVTFVNVPGASYSGVNFGDVPVSTFAPDNSLAALPGSVVFFPHTFTAGGAGTVTFSTTSLASTNIPGWAQEILLDANCSGTTDAGDAPVTGAISLAAGQTVCILVKEFIPAAAPVNAQDQITVTAAFAYAGASPVLITTHSRTDLLTVGNTTTAGLVLTKTVDKAAALPGETLTYTIIYRNNSDGVLSNVVIFDQTPAYTTFVSAGNGPLPAHLTGVTIIAPTVGATGAIRWEFSGTLVSGQSGIVTFSVHVAP